MANNARTRLDFQTGAQTGLKSVHQVRPVDLFAVSLTDGEGKALNRIVMRLRGDNQFYFVFPSGTEDALRKPAGWLQEQLEHMAGSDNASIPQDSVSASALPIGDPAGA